MFKTYGPLKGYVWMFIIITIWNLGFFAWDMIAGKLILAIAMGVCAFVHLGIYLFNRYLDKEHHSE